MDADADAQRLVGPRAVPVVDGGQHGLPGGERVSCGLGVFERRAKQGQKAVAQELVDDAVVAIDDVDHLGKEVVEQRHRLVGRPLAGHGGEAADIEEQHADFAHLARRIGQSGEQTVDHGGRNVLAEQVGDAVTRA